MKNKKQINLDRLDLPVEAYFTSLTSKKQGYAVTQLRVKGYVDLLFKLESLLNVCILALDNPEIDNHKEIPEPAVNIKAVLEIAAQLLPNPEAEFLDGIKTK